MEARRESQPDAERYAQQLRFVCDQLLPDAETASIIGDGAARFAHATSKRRSACISWAAGGIFVELWDGDNNIRDLFDPSYDAAVQTARQWLRGF